MFSVMLLGRDRSAPWNSVDWDADPDWEWRSAAEDTPEQLMSLWQGSVQRSRTLVADALSNGGLDLSPPSPGPTGGLPTCGGSSWTWSRSMAATSAHADLIRESVEWTGR